MFVFLWHFDRNTWSATSCWTNESLGFKMLDTRLAIKRKSLKFGGSFAKFCVQPKRIHLWSACVFECLATNSKSQRLQQSKLNNCSVVGLWQFFVVLLVLSTKNVELTATLYFHFWPRNVKFFLWSRNFELCFFEIRVPNFVQFLNNMKHLE